MIQRPFMRSALLTALLAVSAGTASANTTYSNKNILMHRAQLTNLAMEYTTWHDHVYDIMPGSMHSNLQFAPFYQASQAKDGLAKYFGIGNGSDTFLLGNKVAIALGGGAAPAGANAIANSNIDMRFIIHDPLPNLPRTDGTAPNAAGLQYAPAATVPYEATASMKFAPEQKQYGVRLDYFQDINAPIKNMFLRVSTAAVHVQNNMHMTLSGVKEEENGVDLKIADFFSGAGSNTQQSALTKAKFGGRRSAFGFADVDVSLGHKCLQTDRSHALFSVDITIPTGNRVQANYVFAPMYGNGRHFGLGGSFDGGLHVWRNEVASIRFNAAARYKYLFENSEERTLSLSSSAFGLQNNASKYFLVGKIGAPAGTPLVPMANISSLPVSVKPGHQIDLLASMNFEASNFTFDVGYNPFWKDAENVYLKNFVDGTYGIAPTDMRIVNGAISELIPGTGGANQLPAAYRISATPGGAVALTAANSAKVINASDLDINGITTPSLLSHKIFAGAGYSWQAYGSTEVSFGLGGSYEFASSNADLENYALWAKFNISF